MESGYRTRPLGAAAILDTRHAFRMVGMKNCYMEIDGMAITCGDIRREGLADIVPYYVERDDGEGDFDFAEGSLPTCTPMRSGGVHGIRALGDRVADEGQHARHLRRPPRRGGLVMSPIYLRQRGWRIEASLVRPIRRRRRSLACQIRIPIPRRRTGRDSDRIAAFSLSGNRASL